jgi:hypothetical protein
MSLLCAGCGQVANIQKHKEEVLECQTAQTAAMLRRCGATNPPTRQQIIDERSYMYSEQYVVSEDGKSYKRTYHKIKLADTELSLDAPHSTYKVTVSQVFIECSEISNGNVCVCFCACACAALPRRPSGAA